MRRQPKPCEGTTLGGKSCPMWAVKDGLCAVHAEEIIPRGARVSSEVCVTCGHPDPHTGSGIGVCLADPCGCDGPVSLTHTGALRKLTELRNAHTPVHTRPDWDEYFTTIAETVSTRADCTRAQHGAVVVDDQRRIVSTGYNGAPSGQPGCLTAGACPRGQLTYEQLQSLTGGYDDPQSIGYCVAVHAESNAVLYAGRGRTLGATIYITGEPCHGCRKIIAAAGIARIVYRAKDGSLIVEPHTS